MELIIKEYRGDIPDLNHYGHIAIAGADGKILYECGDPEHITYSRSAAKPIQAIPVIESGAIDKYGITEKELAVMCSSHQGENFHTEAVLSILEKAGLNEQYLLCGTHEPKTDYMIKKFREEGITPTEAHNNCSGKHAGMLITAKMLGKSLNNYYNHTHPIQNKITQTIAEICDYDVNTIAIGIDGCGVPVHAMPLYKFAQGYARMSSPELLAPYRADSVNLVTKAMRGHPEMVGGTNDFTSELMHVFGDRLFCKLGVNGFLAIGLAGKGIGIAIKMEDGQPATLPIAVVKTLMEIKVISEEEATGLKHYESAKVIKNCRGEAVGTRQAVFKLKESGRI